MNLETTTPLADFDAPYGKHITLQQVRYDGGLTLLRVRIREGKQRFTIVELDAQSAQQWADVMADWAQQHADKTPS
jgi:hypothetical protein